ncbi:MAG: N-acetylglucosamine-6-phosphate deacetylase [Clostridia bacterium]|nr:N-acetylglucosamine-6-phosphate deacetylase [Clostridia bacterium]
MTVYKNAVINGVVTDFGVENGKFAFVGKSEADGIDLGGREVIPGLIDIHSHGCVGYDVMDGNQHLDRMSRFYLQNGVTAWYPTTMSMAKQVIESVTAQLPHTSGAQALGYHLEGPFINVDYKGAQEQSAIEQANLSDLKNYHHLGLMTIAPEIEGGLAAIETAQIPVCLGHTAADYDLAVLAFEKGAVCLTHTFNAMKPLHHRNPGPVGAALTKNAYVQVICDGFHLHPAAVMMLYKAFGADRMILISDSMRATGLPDGEYDLGGQTTYVNNGTARLADGTLAGSTATLLTCVKRAMEFGIPKADAIRMATATPAAMMGLQKGKLAAGYDADFVVMDETFTPTHACVEGTFQSLL